MPPVYSTCVCMFFLIPSVLNPFVAALLAQCAFIVQWGGVGGCDVDWLAYWIEGPIINKRIRALDGDAFLQWVGRGNERRLASAGKKKTGIRKGISFDRGGDKKWEKWGRETARIPPARKFHRFTAAAVVVAGGGGGAKVFINWIRDRIWRTSAVVCVRKRERHCWPAVSTSCIHSTLYRSWQCAVHLSVVLLLGTHTTHSIHSFI